MKTSGISPKYKVLRAIIDFEDAEGYPPSVRELCTMTGIKSTSTIHSHIAKLQEEGYISKISAQSRTIRVLKTA